MDKLRYNVDQSTEVFKRATRSQNNAALKLAANAASKRKAEASPKAKDTSKRLAFVDLTNNGSDKVKLAGKKATIKVQPKERSNNENKATRLVTNLAGPKPRAPIKKTRAAATETVEPTNVAARPTVAKTGKVLPKEADSKAKVPSLIKVKVERKETTVTAVEIKKEIVEIKKETVDVSYPDDGSRAPSSSSSTDNTFPPDVKISVTKERKIESPAPLIPRVPLSVKDFDREQLKDPNQVSLYALDIFNYLRERESIFVISNYMDDQFCLTKQMRALLVDWLVEVQETFELNHETLYLSVKIVDLYLSKVRVAKETLQLVGAAAVFIASKYDERSPPLIDDFLYICDGAYSRREMIKAELNVFRTIGFDLGIPLSYRFLRRFGRCANVFMPVLTLARYILESSLLDYQFVSYSDSKMACACLLLALNMTKTSGWTPTLEYYTTYKFEDFKSIVFELNDMLHRPPVDTLNTIRNKYMHQLFFEVAKTPLLKNTELWH